MAMFQFTSITDWTKMKRFAGLAVCYKTGFGWLKGYKLSNGLHFGVIGVYATKFVWPNPGETDDDVTGLTIDRLLSMGDCTGFCYLINRYLKNASLECRPATAEEIQEARNLCEKKAAKIYGKTPDWDELIKEWTMYSRQHEVCMEFSKKLGLHHSLISFTNEPDEIPESARRLQDS